MSEVRRVVTALRFPALAIDDRNRIVAWNRGASELLGFPREDVIGTRFDDVISARDAFGNLHWAGNDALHTMTRRGEVIHPFALEVRDARGFAIPVVVSTDALPGGGNPSSHYLVLRLRPERRQGLAGQLVAALLDRASPGVSASISDDVRPRPAELTQRQREVLRLLARGSSSQEVAERLSISIHTVHNHCRNILGRLHVHNQVEAVAVAIRQRLI